MSETMAADKGLASEELEIVARDSKHVETPKHAGDVLLLDESGKVRRIPIPSTDPNDPLNFR
jgi:hypothetical protein